MNRQASAQPCLSFGIEDRLSSGDNLMKSKIEGHEVIMAQKNKVIESLRMQIAKLKADHEQRCREYEHRMGFLCDKIEKKDSRMDERDEMILWLMEKCM